MSTTGTGGGGGGAGAAGPLKKKYKRKDGDYCKASRRSRGQRAAFDKKYNKGAKLAASRLADDEKHAQAARSLRDAVMMRSMKKKNKEPEPEETDLSKIDYPKGLRNHPILSCYPGGPERMKRDFEEKKKRTAEEYAAEAKKIIEDGHKREVEREKGEEKKEAAVVAAPLVRHLGVCPWGSRCYRQNPAHKLEYSHEEAGGSGGGGGGGAQSEDTIHDAVAYLEEGDYDSWHIRPEYIQSDHATQLVYAAFGDACDELLSDKSDQRCRANTWCNDCFIKAFKPVWKD